MPFAWNPYAAIAFAAAVPPALLAAVLLWSRADRAPNRRLAAFLGLLAAWAVTWGLAVASTDPARMFGLYLLSGVIIALHAWPYLWFLGTLPTPSAGPLDKRAGRVVVAVAASASAATFLVWPAAWIPSVTATGSGQFFPEFDAPWAILDASHIAIAILSFALALSAHRAAAPGLARRRTGAYLVAVAGYSVILGAMLAVAAAGLPLVGAIAFGPWFIVGFLAATVWLGAWLSYGILAAQLFGVDLRIKSGIAKSTVVAVFAVAFLVVSEAVERVLNVEGLLFGLAAAVTIGLVFRRVERLGEAVADRLMPDVEDTEGYRTVRRREVYAAAVESALIDGRITDAERDVLATLADQLDMTAGEARALERDVTGAMGAAGGET